MDGLRVRLERDFRAADFGDTVPQYTSRIEDAVAQAEARMTATPAQQEAGARYHLLGAQLRQLTRQATRQKAASGAEIERNLAVTIAEVRAQMAAELASSGLAPAGRQRQGSMSIPVEVTF